MTNTYVYRFVYLHLVHSINPSTLIMHFVFTFFYTSLFNLNSHEIHYKMSELHPYFFQICRVFLCVHHVKIYEVHPFLANLVCF